ncbi:hypothetical protein ACGFWI_37980 [Streptomyces sp. NPDC048434]|uniref:hypothetical protein n=1 Tax=Streptomyces sp. NPDC048434 TaxID=3365549 RepID=UPI00371F3BAE
MTVTYTPAATGANWLSVVCVEGRRGAEQTGERQAQVHGRGGRPWRNTGGGLPSCRMPVLACPG